MTRWLVQFGYDGAPFRGWARQPGRSTVEGTLRAGIARCGIAEGDGALRLAVASRTDAGVSARANALALDSSLPGPALLRALNGIDPRLFFQAARPVAEGFSPRRAVAREYRYLLEPDDPLLARWGPEIAGILQEGLDARTFGRGIGSGTLVRRPIDLAEVVRSGEGPYFRIRAPGFVWGMVRKVVAGLRAIGTGELTVETLRSAARGEKRLTLALAPPEPLVLWEVAYDEPWDYRAPRPTRAQREFWSGARRAAALSARRYAWLDPAP